MTEAPASPLHYWGGGAEISHVWGLTFQLDEENIFNANCTVEYDSRSFLRSTAPAKSRGVL